jgi:hypothetical protein
VLTADNLTIFMCRLTRNLGASTFWNPKGLSRPVMGLLYLYLYLQFILLYVNSSFISTPILHINSIPLLCNAVQFGRLLPTFRRKMLRSSLSYKVQMQDVFAEYNNNDLSR